MSIPITSSVLFSNEGYPIPTAFTSGSTQRISIVNGPAYVTLESKTQSNGIYTSSANFAGATIDGASPTFSNVVDTSIVSGDFITAGTVGEKGRTGSLNVTINRDLPANEIFIKLESSNPNAYISEIVNDASFVFNVKTDNTGTSNNDQFTLPLVSTFNILTASVDWGDGNTNLISSSAQANKTHTYSSAGTYTVKMTQTTGTVGIKGFKFNNGGDKLKILNVENWGNINFDQPNVFSGCANLTCTAPDFPFAIGDVSSTLFLSCTALTSMDVTRWDVSNMTNIGLLFNGCTNLSDFDPSGWDVGNVTNTNALFKNCEKMDFSLADWNLSSMEQTADGGKGLKNLFADQPGSIVVGISTANYDATLIGWAANPLTPDNLNPDMGDAKYTETNTLVSSSRSSLEQRGWNFTDGGAV